MFDTGFFSLHTALFICANLAVAWYHQKDHAVLKGWFPIKIFHWQYFLLNNCFKCLQQNSFHHHCIWVAADILVADISQNQNYSHGYMLWLRCLCVYVWLRWTDTLSGIHHITQLHLLEIIIQGCMTPSWRNKPLDFELANQFVYMMQCLFHAELRSQWFEITSR